MGLPKLQDYLPPDLDPDQRSSRERDPAELVKRLAAINRFIDDFESWPRLTEKDVEDALAELALIEKKINSHRTRVVSFDQDIHRLLVLRDRLLVREAEEMSRSSFWDDDEP